MADHDIAPQPSPTGDGLEVWPRAIAWAREEGAPVELLALMHERDAFGRQKYGTPLRFHNGRAAAVDALQEILDAYAYLVQDEGELAEASDPGQALERAQVWRLADAIRMRLRARGGEK